MQSPLDDLWCSDCGKSHEGLCKRHGALHKVQDAAIPSRARLTLPSSLTLKTQKENGKTCVGVFSKKIIPVRSQFGPLDAPVAAITKKESKPKKAMTVWKKKHAMQKAMETSGHSQPLDSPDIHPTTTVESAQLLHLPPIQHKGHNSVMSEPAGVATTEMAISNIQQQLMTMTSQAMSHTGVGGDAPLQGFHAGGVNQFPLHSSPIHSNANIHHLHQSLPEFPPIGFPSPPGGSLQLPVTPENIQTLQQQFHQYGHQADLAGIHHNLGLNGFTPSSTAATQQSIASEQPVGGLVTMAPPSDLDGHSVEDSGVVDSSHANMSDSTGMDVTSDTDMDDSSDQDMAFEIKVTTDDGFIKTMDTADEEHSNWMIFVRPARSITEQNLIAYQEDGHVYFVSLKPIPTNTELKVWYSCDYAKAIGKGMLFEEKSTAEDESTWNCSTCNTSFNSSQDMETHPCTVKAKGRRKGRPRKYVKPTKTWRAKLEKSRLKESQRSKVEEIKTNEPATPKRGRGRPRIKPLVIKAEKVEIRPPPPPPPAPILMMDYQADQSDDYEPEPEPEPSPEPVDLFEEKTLVIKEKKKRGPKTMRTPLQCIHCGESFLAEATYYVHVYSHTGIKPFICEVPECKRGFLSKFKLERHRLIHTCPRHHKCPYCDKCFNRKDHLKNHMITHDPNKKVWKCELCGKEYSYSFSYRTHMAFHAAENGETLTCGICKKEFETKEELLFHLKVHTGARAAKNSTEKTHPCFECHKRFFTRKDVKRHMITHTKRKDFLCQFCPQRFGRKDHLTRHLRTSHTGDNQGSLRIKRNSGDNSSPVKRRERTIMFEKMEPTMVPLQMAVPTAIQDDIPDQLIAGITGSQTGSNMAVAAGTSQNTLLQNLQYAVSQIPSHGSAPREVQIPAALYEAAAAASAQQQQEQQQQQQQQQHQQQHQHQEQQTQVAAASIGSLPAPPGMPSIHTSMAPHYQIEKGYVMNTPQAEQALVRQIQVAAGPNIDYRNITQALQGNLTQALQGNMYIATTNLPQLQPQQQQQQQQQLQQQVAQQQQQQQQQQTQPNLLVANKVETQVLEISRANGVPVPIAVANVQPQQQPAQPQHEYHVTTRTLTEVGNTVPSSTEPNRPAVVMASALDPRTQNSAHSQTYSTLLGYMETLRFLENLPTNNTTAIPLQQLQGLNVEMSQPAAQAQLIPAAAAYNTVSGTGNNILNINQAELAKGVVALSHPHVAGATIHLTPQDMKNMVSLAQTVVTPTQHVEYQQQQQQQQQT